MIHAPVMGSYSESCLNSSTLNDTITRTEILSALKEIISPGGYYATVVASINMNI